VVVHFKIPQHCNHDNNVVAMDTDNHQLHWRQFLDRLVGIIKNHNSTSLYRYFGDRQQKSVTCF